METKNKLETVMKTKTEIPDHFLRMKLWINMHMEGM
jgi:hypothetical protein